MFRPQNQNIKLGAFETQNHHKYDEEDEKVINKDKHKGKEKIRSHNKSRYAPKMPERRMPYHRRVYDPASHKKQPEMESRKLRRTKKQRSDPEEKSCRRKRRSPIRIGRRTALKRGKLSYKAIV